MLFLRDRLIDLYTIHHSTIHNIVILVPISKGLSSVFDESSQMQTTYFFPILPINNIYLLRIRKSLLEQIACAIA